MYCPGGNQIYAYEVTWQGQRASSSADTALGQGRSYGYDEFNRLQSSTVNYGTVQNFTYVYDCYGNRWQQNAPQGGPAPQYSGAANRGTQGISESDLEPERNEDRTNSTEGALWMGTGPLL